MSEGKPLNELMAQLPAVTDASGKSVVLTDAQGELTKITGVKLTGISTGFSDSSFANVVGDLGFYLCTAYSKSNRGINCMFLVLMVEKDAVNNSAPYYMLGSSGGLTLSACNSFGTLVFKMSDGSVKPSDLVLRYLRIAI